MGINVSDETVPPSSGYNTYTLKIDVNFRCKRTKKYTSEYHGYMWASNYDAAKKCVHADITSAITSRNKHPVFVYKQQA
jgi:hypothetical protein